MSTSRHRTRGWMIALLAILVSGVAHAESSVTLYPVAPAVPVGGKLRIVLEVQVEQPTLGGGIRVHYDDALVRFLFDPALLLIAVSLGTSSCISGALAHVRVQCDQTSAAAGRRAQCSREAGAKLCAFESDVVSRRLVCEGA
jgi:hypothetical protein